MKTDPIYKTDKDEFGFTRYSNSYYTWLFNSYKIEIEIANTDQVLDEELIIIRYKDRIRIIFISKIKQ